MGSPTFSAASSSTSIASDISDSTRRVWATSTEKLTINLQPSRPPEQPLIFGAPPPVPRHGTVETPEKFKQNLEQAINLKEEVDYVLSMLTTSKGEADCCFTLGGDDLERFRETVETLNLCLKILKNARPKNEKYQEIEETLRQAKELFPLHDELFPVTANQNLPTELTAFLQPCKQLLSSLASKQTQPPQNWQYTSLFARYPSQGGILKPEKQTHPIEPGKAKSYCSSSTLTEPDSHFSEKLYLAFSIAHFISINPFSPVILESRLQALDAACASLLKKDPAGHEIKNIFDNLSSSKKESRKQLFMIIEAVYQASEKLGHQMPELQNLKMLHYKVRVAQPLPTKPEPTDAKVEKTAENLIEFEQTCGHFLQKTVDLWKFLPKNQLFGLISGVRKVYSKFLKLTKE